MLSGGVTAFIFGLAQVGQRASVHTLALVAMLAGLGLVAAFVFYARHTEAPLLDVRLFAQRGFGSAAATNFVLGISLFGVALLLALYFQIVPAVAAGDGPAADPQGLGAALSISVAGALTDKFGARRIVPVGVVLALAGTVAFSQVGAGRRTGISRSRCL